MPRSHRFVFGSLAVVLVVVTSLAASASSSSPRELAARIVELDQEVQRRLADFDPHQPAVSREDELAVVDFFEGQLAGLELRAASAGGEGEVLRTKVEAVRRVLRNLRQAIEQGRRPQVAVPLVAAPQPQPAAPLFHDACAAAPELPVVVTVGTTAGATLDGAASCGASLFTPDVWYRIRSTTSGYVSIDSFGSGYDTVLSVHSACPGTLDNQSTCNDDAFGLQAAVSFYASAGVSYYLRVSGAGGATGAFQLQRGDGGALVGTVAGTAGAGPIAASAVYVYDREGFFASSTTTDAAGAFTFAGLDPGAYFVATRNQQGWVDELYDGFLCANSFSGCDVSQGTPVRVPASGASSSVNFVLDRGGEITGTVRDEAGVLGLGGAIVRAYRPSGDFVTSAVSDGAGAYHVTNLPPGTYHLIASATGHADELYPDAWCFDIPYSCQVSTGTPVVVAANSTTASIHFALDRLGDVSGRVTDHTGAPLAGATVRSVDLSDLSPPRFATSDAQGDFVLAGLYPGSHGVQASKAGYRGTVFAGFPCDDFYFYSCYDLATPVNVVRGSTHSGIDFVLPRFGGIEGTVTVASSGMPVSGARVALYHLDGYFERSTVTDALGRYEFPGLQVGGYRLHTSQTSGYVQEVWNDRPCLGTCQTDTGDLVLVDYAQTTTASFQLDLAGGVTGTVRDSAGNALAGATVSLYDSAGALVGTSPSLADGGYDFSGLPAGSYFVAARSVTFASQLYAQLPCPLDACQVTAGTPVQVTVGQGVAGIDFQLGPRGSIAGRVTEAVSGLPLLDYPVRLHNSQGWVDTDYTDAGGNYQFPDVQPGTYTVLTSGQWGHRDELFANRPCEPQCVESAGDPVVVGSGQAVEGIDFELIPFTRFEGTVRDAVTQQPLAQALIHFYPFDYAQYSTETNSQGQFAVTLPAGNYRLVSEAQGYAPELYSEVACVGPWYAPCDLTAGVPLAATYGQVFSGLDFTLERFGGLSGRVTEEGTGASLPGGQVRLYRYDGTLVDTIYPTATGHYERQGLAPGNYFVVAAGYSPSHVDELHPDVPCLGGPPAGCMLRLGAPVTVQAGATTAEVDFSLRRLRSEILGTVTHRRTGAPLPGVLVDIWSAAGGLVASRSSDFNGAFSVLLAPGSYYVSTDTGGAYTNQLHQNVWCWQGSAFSGLCPLTQGDLVTLSSQGTGATVHFALDVGAIFADSFETGSLAGWSVVQGGTP